MTHNRRESGNTQFCSLFQKPLEACRFEQTLTENDMYRRLAFTCSALQHLYLNRRSATPGDDTHQFITTIVEQDKLLTNGKVQDIVHLMGQFLGQGHCFAWSNGTLSLRGNKEAMH